MKVGALKKMLSDIPDDMMVLIPGEPNEGFTGLFFSPCEHDSGVIELGGDENTTLQEVEAFERDQLDLPTEKSFLLVPCGYFNEHDDTHKLN